MHDPAKDLATAWTSPLSRAHGADIDDEAPAHLSPAMLDHINPYGKFLFDVDLELGRTARRPLRRPGASPA